jgi:hypothetical protein
MDPWLLSVELKNRQLLTILNEAMRSEEWAIWQLWSPSFSAFSPTSLEECASLSKHHAALEGLEDAAPKIISKAYREDQ